MKQLSVFVAMCLLVMLSSCGGFMSGGGGGAARKKRENTQYKIYFEDVKYEAALEMAVKEQKPVFLDFYTDWCAPCKWLEKDAFETEMAAKYFNKNLVSIKINGEKGEGVDLVQRFAIKAYPTMIFVHPTGRELHRFMGLTSARGLVSEAKKAVQVIEKENKAKSKSKK